MKVGIGDATEAGRVPMKRENLVFIGIEEIVAIRNDTRVRCTAYAVNIQDRKVY